MLCSFDQRCCVFWAVKFVKVFQRIQSASSFSSTKKIILIQLWIYDQAERNFFRAIEIRDEKLKFLNSNIFVVKMLREQIVVLLFLILNDTLMLVVAIGFVSYWVSFAIPQGSVINVWEPSFLLLLFSLSKHSAITRKYRTIFIEHCSICFFVPAKRNDHEKFIDFAYSLRSTEIFVSFRRTTGQDD